MCVYFHYISLLNFIKCVYSFCSIQSISIYVHFRPYIVPQLFSHIWNNLHTLNSCALFFCISLFFFSLSHSLLLFSSPFSLISHTLTRTNMKNVKLLEIALHHETCENSTTMISVLDWITPAYSVLSCYLSCARFLFLP